MFSKLSKSRYHQKILNYIKSTTWQTQNTRSLASTTTLPELQVYNPEGTKRVLVTKSLPGNRWKDILIKANCRIEVCEKSTDILSIDTIKTLIGIECDAVLGQLTEDWGEELFSHLKSAGGRIYSNYAVGYNNVKVDAATKHKIPVGNTPGVLTETTAETAVSLTFAAARRIVESDKFMRNGHYKGWLPNLFVGKLLQGKTVGVIGAGRIGTAYAKMMVEGHKMDLIYYDPYPNEKLESYMKSYGDFLESQGEKRINCTRYEDINEVFKIADVISLHCNLDANTKHLVNKEKLNIMKKDAILINAARGPVVDESALVSHLEKNPEFKCGLDVFEDEPLMKPGLEKCENAVIVPHIASASLWTRSGMASLAASNIAGRLLDYPVWNKSDIMSFVDGDLKLMPKASPSIVNAKELNLPCV